jgi:hypothetical protein
MKALRKRLAFAALGAMAFGGLAPLFYIHIGVNGSQWPFWHGKRTSVGLLLTETVCWLVAVCAALFALFLLVRFLCIEAGIYDPNATRKVTCPRCHGSGRV